MKGDVIRDINLPHIDLFRGRGNNVYSPRRVIVDGSASTVTTCEELLAPALGIKRVLSVHGTTLCTLHLGQSLG